MSTQLPNISLVQEAGSFMSGWDLRFKSAWKELNLHARVSSKSPNLGMGSHSHLTPAGGAQARGRGQTLPPDCLYLST